MAEPASLSVHRLLPGSLANGPGLRAVIWVQGCRLACPGCFNPASHPASGGKERTVDELLCWVRSCSAELEGITISGGEPLLQAGPLSDMLSRLRQTTRLSTIVFTGFEWSEVTRMPEFEVLRRSVDVFIPGRYRQEQRLAEGLRGSANQSVYLLTDRYTNDDLRAVPPAELLLTPGGDIVLRAWPDRDGDRAQISITAPRSFNICRRPRPNDERSSDGRDFNPSPP